MCFLLAAAAAEVVCGGGGGWSLTAAEVPEIKVVLVLRRAGRVRRERRRVVSRGVRRRVDPRVLAIRAHDRGRVDARSTAPSDASQACSDATAIDPESTAGSVELSSHYATSGRLAMPAIIADKL